MGVTLFDWMSTWSLGRCFASQRCRHALTPAVCVLLLACSKESSRAEQEAAPSASPKSSGPPAVATLVSGEKFGCQHLRTQEASLGEPARTIRLRPPDLDGKTIVLDKTGVVAIFSRDEFLTTARCLGLKKAVAYVERETGYTQQSPLRDAFQLSYVAAALLDVGRVAVRLRDEEKSRSTIVRESWSSESCAGQCRAVGRIYRLSKSDPAFFFQVVDRREDKNK